VSTVYALVHVPSGRFYIGSTNRPPAQRFDQWLLKLARAQAWCPGGKWRPGCPVPRNFMAFGWEVSEWAIAELQAADGCVIRQREREQIDRAARINPSLLLNRVSASTKHPRDAEPEEAPRP